MNERLGDSIAEHPHFQLRITDKLTGASALEEGTDGDFATQCTEEVAIQGNTAGPNEISSQK